MKKILFILIIFQMYCSNKPSQENMERAKNIYASNCMMCHGENGYGDGVSAGAFNPPPRNFHLPTEKWVNGKSIEGIKKTLTYGIEPNMWKYGGDVKDIEPRAYYVMELGKK